jgi:hypothetical protein
LREEPDDDGVGRLGLLASAISRRPLQVAPAEPGEPAWTDGKVVYVDVHESTREQIESLVVQASLLAAGSLGEHRGRFAAAADARPALPRRRGTASRRSSRCCLSSVRSLIRPMRRQAATRRLLLFLHASGRTIVDPPASFGTIRAQRLLVDA